MKLCDIAEKLGCEIVGNAEMEVSGIAFAKDAKREELAVAFKEREIHSTKAEAVLTLPVLCLTEKSLVICHDGIGETFVNIIRMFIAVGIYKDYSLPVELKKCGDYYIGKKCKIANDVYIGCSAVIEDDVVIDTGSVISHSAVIKSGSCIGKNVRIGCSSVIGADAFYTYKEKDHVQIFCGIRKTVIEDNVYIGNFASIERGTLHDTVIKSGTKIADFVNIGHDTVIGHGCKIVSQSGTSGNVTIGDRVSIYGQSCVVNGVQIGNDVAILAKSCVTKNIRRGAIVSGMYARNHVKELETISKIRKL